MILLLLLLLNITINRYFINIFVLKILSVRIKVKKIKFVPICQFHAPQVYKKIFIKLVKVVIEKKVVNFFLNLLRIF